jgi:hypothetical protein
MAQCQSILRNTNICLPSGISYTTLEEMLSDLKEGHIDGILLDALSSNNLNKTALPETSFGIAKTFDLSFSYGIGISGDAMKLEHLFNKYIKHNPVSLEDGKKKEDSGTQIHPSEEVRKPRVVIS